MKPTHGPTIKLLRLESEVTLNNLFEHTNINKQVISKFERNLENLSINQIVKLYDFFNLKMINNDNELKTIYLKCENFIKEIYYHNDKYLDTYHILNKERHLLSATPYYPLLYIFNYIVLIKTKQTDSIHEIENILLSIEDYIPTSWKSLFRAYYGIHRVKNNIPYNFSNDLADTSNHYIKGIVYFYSILNDLNCKNNTMLFYHFEKAKNNFNVLSNYARLIELDYLKVFIYKQIEDFYSAYELLKIVYSNFIIFHFKYNEELILLNLIYLSILSHQTDDLYMQSQHWQNKKYQTIVSKICRDSEPTLITLNKVITTRQLLMLNHVPYVHKNNENE